MGDCFSQPGPIGRKIMSERVEPLPQPPKPPEIGINEILVILKLQGELLESLSDKVDRMAGTIDNIEGYAASIHREVR